MDGAGRDLATGRAPEPPGWPSPVTALAAAPVAAWPVSVVDGAGARLGLARVLGTGGDGVERLLGALAAREPIDDRAVDALARSTPAGPVRLPVARVSMPDAVTAAAVVDGPWLAAIDRLRSSCREALVAAGRSGELEAALHVAMLLATEWLDPADDEDTDAHVASGARLWLVTGAVASALAAADPDPFVAWAGLVAAGWWPVGPSGGRLVVGRPG